MNGAQGPALWGAAGLVFNAAVWGLSWWPMRWLQAQGLHPLWATALIYALAVLAITAWRPLAWKELLQTPALWVLVLASGTTNAAFNWGVTVGDVVRVVLLFYTMPLWAVLLARLLLNEPLRARSLMRVALAVAGAAIVLWPPNGGWPWPQTLAEGLGLLGGFSFALNNVMLKREGARSFGARALAMFSGGMWVAGALALTQTDTVPGLPAWGWPWVLATVALGTLFLASNLALQYGAARLSANVTAVVMITEVLFASVSAWWLGAGSLSLPLVLGGSLIVAAALLAALGNEAQESH